eukprot:CAMPEP_0119337088 /NCGR_PEP_ID=MMETSP1333-20130426/93228_1 /TAXON_ID=418940 /ORGANISM="Scyphosphaera apsteinii, Strain RCC1455" /LENGTH=285 /DNA_ID=CAMNT_0007348053 /DNA_START=82 /DNA_END=936 /DNA_ORIENTATION=-
MTETSITTCKLSVESSSLGLALQRTFARGTAWIDPRAWSVNSVQYSIEPLKVARGDALGMAARCYVEQQGGVVLSDGTIEQRYPSLYSQLLAERDSHAQACLSAAAAESRWLALASLYEKEKREYISQIASLTASLESERVDHTAALASKIAACDAAEAKHACLSVNVESERVEHASALACAVAAVEEAERATALKVYAEHAAAKSILCGAIFDLETCVHELNTELLWRVASERAQQSVHLEAEEVRPPFKRSGGWERGQDAKTCRQGLKAPNCIEFVHNGRGVW